MNSTPIPVLPSLVGTKLKDGWEVVRELPRPTATASTEKSGGNFSFGCVAERSVRGKPNEVAFVKIFDFGKALAVTGDTMRAASLMTTSFSAEVGILDRCREIGLDRVIKKHSAGDIAPFPGMTFPTPYIILEHADADLRKVVHDASYDIAWKLRALHDIAVGINQIHGQDISHYDLKPSNILVFDEAGEGAKLADFGLSIDHRQAGPNARPPLFARSYMPPEVAYGINPATPVDRTRGVDVYHLGCLTTFLLAGDIPTSHYVANLVSEMKPTHWGGEGKVTYEDALPFLVKIHTQFVAWVSESVPEQFRAELTKAISELTHPDYSQRGEPDHRSRVGCPHGVDAYSNKFDRLSRQALTKLAKQA